MGEDSRTKSTTVTSGGDPDQIRREIESTRQELGDTVAALSAKTDVKAQAKQKVEDTKTTVAEKRTSCSARPSRPRLRAQPQLPLGRPSRRGRTRSR